MNDIGDPLPERQSSHCQIRAVTQNTAIENWKTISHPKGVAYRRYSAHQLGRVVAVEAEPPELAAPVVEPGVVAEVLAVLPLEPLPDDEPGACCFTVLVETSQH